VTAILPRHVSFFLAYLAVVAVKARRLGVRHFTIPYLLMYAPVLIREPMIDFGAAWVRRIPVGLRRRGACE
jgi:hypothetical protein